MASKYPGKVDGGLVVRSKQNSRANAVVCSAVLLAFRRSLSNFVAFHLCEFPRTAYATATVILPFPNENILLILEIMESVRCACALRRCLISPRAFWMRLTLDRSLIYVYALRTTENNISFRGHKGSEINFIACSPIGCSSSLILFISVRINNNKNKNPYKQLMARTSMK